MTKILEEAFKDMLDEEHEQGKIDAIQTALLMVLATKGKISAEIKQEICRQKNYRGLMRLLEIAVDVPSVEVFQESALDWL